MKKTLAILLAITLLCTLFTACAKDEDAKVIRVGASITPHAEILEVVKDNLAEQGYTLEIVEFTDYVLPNTAVESGELDANYFQHLPYLEDFNAEHGTHLVSVGAVHYEPYGIYAGRCDSLDNIPDGAKIAVPNDSTNEARALQLLAEIGLITIREGAGLSATVLDIVDNPKNIQIVELESAQIPRSLLDVDFGVINGNYAIEAGFSASDALALESANSLAAQTYGNILVVREGNENREDIQALYAALCSDEVRNLSQAPMATLLCRFFRSDSPI